MKKILSIILMVTMIAGVFSMPVYAEAINAESITLTGANGGAPAITKLANTVTVDFGTAMTAEGIADKISLAKNGGSAVTIAAEVDGTDSKTVNISYGELEENASYTLTLASGITARNGDTLAENKTFTLNTSETVYRIKEDFNYDLTKADTAADADTDPDPVTTSDLFLDSDNPYSSDNANPLGNCKLPSGLRVSGGTTGNHGVMRVTADENYKYLEQNTNDDFVIADPIHYSGDGYKEYKLTEDFAFEIELKGIEGKKFFDGLLNISTEANASTGDIDSNDLAIIPKTQYISDMGEWIRFADSGTAGGDIEMTADSKAAWTDRMTLNKNEYGFSMIKLVGRMENDGNFSMEASSGDSRHSITYFERFPSYNSFALKNWRGIEYVGGADAADKLSIGKVYIYKISPLKILKEGIVDENYEVTVTDDIAVFPTSGILTEENYNRGKNLGKARTFVIPLANCVSGENNYTLEGLRTDDGAYSNAAGTSFEAPDKLDVDANFSKLHSIKKLAGSIEIPFSDNVEAASLKNKITLTKVGGAETPVAAEVVDGNKVKVSYGDLEEGAEYTLTLKKGIEGTGGLSLPADRTITLKTDKSVYYAKSDFSRYEENQTFTSSDGTSQAETKEFGFYLKRHEATTWANTVKTAASGANYMEFTGTGWNNTFIADKSFNDSNAQAITGDFVYEVEYSYNGYFDVGQMRMFKQPLTGDVANLAKPDNAAILMNDTMYGGGGFSNGCENGVTTGTGNKEGYDALQNTDGFYSLKLVGRKASDTSYAIEYSTPGKDSKTVTYNNLPQVGTIGIKMYTPEGKSGVFNLAKFNYYEITPLKVLDQYTEGDKVIIVMNDEISKFQTEGIFTEANYTAAANLGKARAFAVNADSLTAASYSLAGLRTDDGAFSDALVAIEAPEKDITITGFGVGSSEMTVKVSDEVRNANTFIVAAIYGADKSLLKAEVIKNFDDDGTAEVSLAGLALGEKCTAKCFAWKSPANLIPYAGVAPTPYARQ